MARYPNAIWRPLPRNAQQPAIKPVGVVLHTAVSNSSSLYDFFNGRSNGVESHFYIRENGTVEQYIDTNVRADCQLDGNSWLHNGERYGFISIETWDGGHPETNPWNQAQLDNINSLIRWASVTHNFPVVKATGAQGMGIGYHQQFTGTSFPRWNETHSCPGSKRIAQVPGIISRLQAPVAKPTNTDPLPIPEDSSVPYQVFKVHGKESLGLFVRTINGIHHIENKDVLDWHRAQGTVTKTTVTISQDKFNNLSEKE